MVWHRSPGLRACGVCVCPGDRVPGCGERFVCLVWCAFVCRLFTCGLAFEFEVCRVRFARVSCPRLRFGGIIDPTSISFFYLKDRGGDGRGGCRWGRDGLSVMGWSGAVAWLLRAYRRGAVGRGLVWAGAAVSPGLL